MNVDESDGELADAGSIAFAHASSNKDVTDDLNPRAEIVALLRGASSVPVIATLGARGVISRLLAGAFSPTSDDPSPSTLTILLDYLTSQGLLRRSLKHGVSSDEDGINHYSYIPTPLGRKVLARWGSFAILNSYSDYFHQLNELLDTRALANRPAVRRKENVVGSGEAHARKFFPLGLRMITQRPVEVLVDLGCGDGRFAAALCEMQPPRFIRGVDLNEDVTDTFRKRVGTLATCDTVAVDAAQVARWTDGLERFRTQRIVISAWFVLHEFCESDTAEATRFFNSVHDRCPTAELLIGEIVGHTPELLAFNRTTTALPEFQLFHALSRQGLLSWRQLEQLRDRIPYDVVAEQGFDRLYGPAGEVYPSNIIWHLIPR